MPYTSVLIPLVVENSPIKRKAARTSKNALRFSYRRICSKDYTCLGQLAAFLSYNDVYKYAQQNAMKKLALHLVYDVFSSVRNTNVGNSFMQMQRKVILSYFIVLHLIKYFLYRFFSFFCLETNISKYFMHFQFSLKIGRYQTISFILCI